MSFRFRFWREWACLLLLALLLPGGALLVNAQAATLVVNGTTGTVHTGDACPTPRASGVYRAIQAAINCALDGDTLQIAAGTYPETLSLAKSLTLQGAGAASTIINSGAAGRVLTLDAAVNASIDQLTLTNGKAADGGGIFTRASTLTIADSIISSNVATHQGGGLLTKAGSVFLTNTQITGNSAPDGGGLFTEGGTITLDNAFITGNSATGAGGGVFTVAGSLDGAGAVSNNTASSDADIHSVVGAVGIDPVLLSNISVTVKLQGRPAAPNALLSLALRVTITPNGSATPVYDSTVTTDLQGAFALNSITPGEYDIRVKGAHTLSNLRTVSLSAGPNTVDMGLLREGDTDNNNIINLVDFSLLAASFGKATGSAGFDGRADFNGDGVVNLTDFSLLATNFGQSGQGAGGAQPPTLPTPGDENSTPLPLPTALPVNPTEPATIEPPTDAQPTAAPTIEPPTDTPPTATPTVEPPTPEPATLAPPSDAPGSTDEAPR